jgi:hypothetical protein
VVKRCEPHGNVLVLTIGDSLSLAGLGHQCTAPVRGIGRGFLSGLGNHLQPCFHGQRRHARGPCLVALEACHAFIEIPLLQPTRHPCRHPPTASASDMRLTAVQPQTGRKRQDRFVQSAENHHLRASKAPVRSTRHPPSSVSATPETLRGKRYLIRRPDQATLALDGRPLGECRAKF